LLEGSEGTVLYTGDFRLTKEELMSFEHLKSGSRWVVTYLLFRLEMFVVNVKHMLAQLLLFLRFTDVYLVYKSIEFASCQIFNFKSGALGFVYVFRCGQMHDASRLVQWWVRIRFEHCVFY
jgi:hypothetical protein